MSTANPALPHAAAPSVRGQLNGVLFVALFAAAVTSLSSLPAIARLGLSPLIVGIIAGTVYGNALRDGMPASWAAGVNFSARKLLRIAVAFFGLRVSLQEIAQVGLPGLAVSALMVVSTLLIGTWVGMRLFKLDRDTALLTAAGSAICGAAAVLAFESTLQSKPHQSAMAVGSVVLFGTLSMFAYPLAYHAGWIPLDAQGLGLFFGGTIHEVAQVVGAASDVSPQVTHTATIVKMTRVMLLVPVLLALGAWLAHSARQSRAADGAAAGHGKRRLAVPWFALGFLGFVIVNSLGVLPDATLHTLNTLDTFALTMAMTALGIETRLAQIRAAGPRALGAGLVLYAWLIAGGFGITWLVERWLG
ncbi:MULTISPECIES: YeiH family protein [unclassified Burkholderia]|uniref:YeiH family protein n=1 Tax=unclassified Burkholderia TaxID=2613784 RepID=UPI00141F6BB5|nr:MULTISPECIES: YeiH family protein [unclassified Burkholderia]NIE87029.1 YeiH family putative sulfate export transporter [Burkholderia sp. Tr-860]NIF98688.1 YeiH family putative sulfate export transporter [Burkholderia sp. Ax-1720]